MAKANLCSYWSEYKQRFIHTGAITSPTKKSATAREVMKIFETVLRDAFLAISHRTTAFPVIAAKPAIPNHDDREFYRAILSILLSPIDLFSQVSFVISFFLNCAYGFDEKV